MSIKTIEIHICDKCEKEIKGRLTTKKCPCCGKEFCLECYEKANPGEKPTRERRKPIEHTESPYPHLLIAEPTSPETGWAVTLLDGKFKESLPSASGITLKEAMELALPSKLPGYLTEQEREFIEKTLES